MKEGKKMKKWIGTIGMAIFLSGAAWAGSASLSSLAQNEQELSSQIRQAYLRGDDPANLYNELIKVHKKIRKQASVDPETDNMAAFLTICLQDLRHAITVPRNPRNIGVVVDLDDTIQEGAGYIRTLSRGKALATR
jgi:hypothetical protein